MTRCSVARGLGLAVPLLSSFALNAAECRPAATDLAKKTGEFHGVKVKPAGNRRLQPVADRFFYWLRASRLETHRLAYWWANRMLAFLDAAVNVKGAPNENFARKITELFTMGVGNYTETDIREAARAFTGWNFVDLNFVISPDKHDGTVKTVLGRSGNFDGVAVIDVILAHPVTAEYIADKIYRYFVRDEISPELRKKLGAKLREEDFNTRLASYRGWQMAIQKVKPIPRATAQLDLAGMVRAAGCRADDMVMLLFSEFGRRVPENTSLGTDHGTANHMYLIGKPVKGGHYGTPPKLDALDEGDNLVFTTDFRRVYASVIEGWLGHRDTRKLLSGNFETFPIFG